MTMAETCFKGLRVILREDLYQTLVPCTVAQVQHGRNQSPTPKQPQRPHRSRTTTKTFLPQRPRRNTKETKIKSSPQRPQSLAEKDFEFTAKFARKSMISRASWYEVLTR